MLRKGMWVKVVEDLKGLNCLGPQEKPKYEAGTPMFPKRDCAAGTVGIIFTLAFDEGFFHVELHSVDANGETTMRYFGVDASKLRQCKRADIPSDRHPKKVLRDANGMPVRDEETGKAVETDEVDDDRLTVMGY